MGRRSREVVTCYAVEFRGQIDALFRFEADAIEYADRLTRTRNQLATVHAWAVPSTDWEFEE